LASSAASTSINSSGSGSGSAFGLVDRVVFVFFDLMALRPPAVFLFPLLVAVDAVDMLDASEVVLVSMDSSRSGMSVMLGASLSDSIDMFDCVDSLVEAFDVRADLEALPFFAFGLFEGAVVPAKMKNGHSGFRR
jgi:hypothetical protein